MKFQAIVEGNEYYGSPSETRAQAIADDMATFLKGQYSVLFREDSLAPGLVRPVVILDYEIEPLPPHDVHMNLTYRVSEAMDAAGLYAVRAWIKALPDPTLAAIEMAARGGAAGATIGDTVGNSESGTTPMIVGGLLGAVFGGLLGAAISTYGRFVLGATRIDGMWRFYHTTDRGDVQWLPTASSQPAPA